MMIPHTIAQLKQLRLTGMALALERQQEIPMEQALSFEERLSMLVDDEVNYRENRRLQRILKDAKLKSADACIENIDYRLRRGLDRSLIASLANCHWIQMHQSLLITGATGCGKTWLACAFGNQAARKGLTVQYHRTPRLLESLEIAHADGSLPKLRQQLAKADLLILDDWGLSPLNLMARSDLLELIDDRMGSGSIIITSQLPIESWHGYIGDPTLADAILDRLLHTSHRLLLKGESMRKVEPAKQV